MKHTVLYTLRWGLPVLTSCRFVLVRKPKETPAPTAFGHAPVRSINLAMVHAYFEIGRIIVEEEQGGDDRAQYGKQVLQRLSRRLTDEFGKGYSPDNLKLMRRFYIV